MKRLVELTQNNNCTDCKICCRFCEETPNLKPTGLKLVKTGDMYVCEFFDTSSGKCAGYGKRPFDCEIYPFAVAKSPSGEDILLVIDSLCANTADILEKLDPVLLASLDFPESAAIEWEETFIPLKVLKSGKNTSDDFSLLERKSRYFFTQSFKNPPSLSAYGFAYHFIWDDVTKYYWKTIVPYDGFGALTD